MIALGLACSCVFLNFFFNGKIGNDTAAFYTRMASQFGQGNYGRAFFHSVSPLMPVLAGVFCKTGFTSWQAMKLVSGLFFILSVYWVYRLARLRLAPEQAQWCAVIYVGCSRLLRYGMAGQLEAAKMFFLLVAFEQTLCFIRNPKWRHLVFSGMAAGFLGLSRNEGFMSLPPLCLILLTIPFGLVRSEGQSSPVVTGLLRRVTACGILLSVCLMVWSPWLVYQYKVTGYPSISSKLTIIAERLFKLPKSTVSAADEAHSQYIRKLREQAPGEHSGGGASESESFFSQFSDPKMGTLPFKFIQTWEGLVPYFFFPALLGIWLLLRRHQWQPFDTAMAIALGGHLLLLWLLAPNFIKRIIVPYIPFYFSWTWHGLRGIYKVFTQKLPRGLVHARRWGYAVLTLVIVVSIWDGMSSVRKTLRGKVAIEHEIAQWIRERGDALDINKTGPLDSILTPWGYQNGGKLVIASTSPQIPSLVDADWVRLNIYPGPQMSLRQLIEVLRSWNVDILLVDEDFHERFPLFSEWETGDVRHFVFLREISGVRIYRVRMAQEALALK